MKERLLKNCSKPHEFQVLSTEPLPEGPYPGQKAVDETIDGKCDDMLNAFFEKHPQHLFLDYYGVSPTRSDWAEGNRQVLCLVSPIESDFLHRSLVP
ncbi:septum formation family protein [Actinocorallia aurantiaca]|uniref:Septum formation-related domain-containing protein n=1 Tax=Actinocorallia aurantiaca TaxID=46204 RepID=A0ABP6H3K2_9ACTN